MASLTRFEILLEPPPLPGLVQRIERDYQKKQYARENRQRERYGLPVPHEGLYTGERYFTVRDPDGGGGGGGAASFIFTVAPRPNVPFTLRTTVDTVPILAADFVAVLIVILTSVVFLVVMPVGVLRSVTPQVPIQVQFAERSAPRVLVDLAWRQHHHALLAVTYGAVDALLQLVVEKLLTLRTDRRHC